MNNKMINALTNVAAGLMGLTLSAGALTFVAPSRALAQQNGQASAAKSPQWGSLDEYNAFQAMLKETDPHKKVTLADAFLEKFPKSDFKGQADLIKVQAYQQLNDSTQAMQAAHDALAVDADNIGALNYLSFAFPFVFKATDANAATELSDAEANAKRGLDVLQKTQKPANVSQEQFDTQVKQLRANFNGALGFVALQQKDYAGAITSLKAAQEDNPSDPYITYRLGLAYINSNPPDYNNAIWNLARASKLAQDAKSTDADAIQKYYGQVYESRHGSNQGEQDLVAQAAASPTPTSGFNVAPPEKHKPTGNQFVDFFYSLQDGVNAGGDTAQKTWASAKGQPLAGVGWVAGVEKDSSDCLVRVNIISADKAKDGEYQVALQDDSQPGCKDLAKGDPVRIQGTISAYTGTPSFFLTLASGKVDQASLDAAEARVEAEKKKNEPKHRTQIHRTDQ